MQNAHYPLNLQNTINGVSNKAAVKLLDDYI